MPKLTIVFGCILIALGLFGYMGYNTTEATSDEAATTVADDAVAADDAEPAEKKRSVTALIPAILGGLLVLFGAVAMNEKMRMHAMHAAVLVGLLGVIAGGGRVGMKAGAFFANDPSLNRRAFVFVVAMTIICLVYVILCVRSFIAARQQKKLEEASAA